MPALYSPSVDPAGAAAADNSVAADSAAANSVNVAALEVTYPGSMAPHIRVQTLAGSGAEREWKLVASFSDALLAQACLERLRRQGEVARLIAYRRVPIAA